MYTCTSHQAQRPPAVGRPLSNTERADHATPYLYTNPILLHPLVATPAVLTIAPGDSVATTTLCARGMDADRNSIGSRPNPMTGPFYIEGAVPGDTLVVQIDRVVPNRTFGWSSAMLAPNVVDPDHVPHLPWDAEGQRPLAEWHVDVDAGTAKVVEPDFDDPIELPLRPMIGCFGVAPALGEAISTATSGQHGGNMDYRHFIAGATVYFPVFTEGALFFLGDGHAQQGDGEMSGTGIEISCDMGFTVDLIKGQRISWPRGENSDYIFTVGNARPLDQAVQHATTEMVDWLTKGYGMSPARAHTLMGQAVEYDLGNMFDPAYTMVCKMAKRRLGE